MKQNESTESKSTKKTEMSENFKVSENFEKSEKLETSENPENLKIGEKTAMVTILGRPSSGKSTFLNSACQEPVSIVSPIPQTTRNAIRGIVNTSLGQLVFVDTPGYHDSEKKLNLRLKSVTEEQLEGADCILYIIDTTRIPGTEEQMIIALAENHTENLVVALNKIDLPESNAEKTREFVKQNLPSLPEDRIFEMSAEKDIGIDEILRTLYGLAPVQPHFYTENVYTDQNISFRISEIIRGEAINRLEQEIPHCLYVNIADIESRGENGKLWVRAFLCVERESQKGMVIGKGASMIKSIRMASMKKMKEVFPFKIDLDLQVKVDKNWRQHDNTLSRLI